MRIFLTFAVNVQVKTKRVVSIDAYCVYNLFVIDCIYAIFLAVKRSSFHFFGTFCRKHHVTKVGGEEQWSCARGVFLHNEIFAIYLFFTILHDNTSFLALLFVRRILCEPTYFSHKCVKCLFNIDSGFCRSFNEFAAKLSRQVFALYHRKR